LSIHLVDVYAEYELVVARAAAREQLRADRAELVAPYPPGLEFRHRCASSICDPGRPEWLGVERAAGLLEEARERAAIELPEDASDTDFQRATEALVRELVGPDWDRWVRVERQCLLDCRARAAAKRGAAGESTARAAARHRQEAIRQGIDVGSAEYRDTLRGGEGPKPAKRRRSSGGRFRPG